MLDKTKLLYSLFLTVVYTSLFLFFILATNHPALSSVVLETSKSYITGLFGAVRHFGGESLGDEAAAGSEPAAPTNETGSLKKSVLLDAPVIRQLPELPRGCEVTSLAMLLNHAGVPLDKMRLAEEIHKEPTPYQIKNGEIYFGNPHDGFVGSMYSLNQPGLGVYHEPIEQLAEKYLPERILDFTGGDFTEILENLNHGRPVWVIINTEFAKLPESFFQTWRTPSGNVKVTFKEHSVLITGYDEQFIYFNDPLDGTKNKKKPINDFKSAWEQMGRQAITYTQPALRDETEVNHADETA